MRVIWRTKAETWGEKRTSFKASSSARAELMIAFPAV